jgi:hypothetical protein
MIQDGLLVGSTGTLGHSGSSVFSVYRAALNLVELQSSVVAAGNDLCGIRGVAYANSSGYEQQSDILVRMQGGTAYQRGSMLVFRTKPNAATGDPSTRLCIHNDGIVTYGTETRPATDCTNTVFINGGKDPSDCPAGCFGIFASAQGGYAVPGFITEAGVKLKLYKGTALTAADNSTVDATYGTEERDVIKNLRTRLGEIEAFLQGMNLL